MRDVLRALRSLLPDEEHDLLSDEAIAEAITQHAPLGQKKKLILLPPHRIQRITPSGARMKSTGSPNTGSRVAIARSGA